MVREPYALVLICCYALQVRVWDLELGKCLICFNFGRPIASLAFHAAGSFLAVASGHKVLPACHCLNPICHHAMPLCLQALPVAGTRLFLVLQSHGRSLECRLR